MHKRVAGTSPVGISQSGVSPWASVHWTFAYTPPALSPIDECLLNFRQCALWTSANWRMSIELCASNEIAAPKINIDSYSVPRRYSFIPSSQVLSSFRYTPSMPVTTRDAAYVVARKERRRKTMCRSPADPHPHLLSYCPILNLSSSIIVSKYLVLVDSYFTNHAFKNWSDHIWMRPDWLAEGLHATPHIVVDLVVLKDLFAAFDSLLGRSLIGERPVNFRQCISWSSPIGEILLNFRQYIHCLFANYWRNSYWRRSDSPHKQAQRNMDDISMQLSDSDKTRNECPI